MLEDRDNFARHQAVLMLEESGFLDEKVSTLARPDARDRALGEAFVKRFLEIGQTGRLHELAANHPDAGVRGALRTMIERAAAPGEERS
jgi:hypothetical protein